MSKIQNFLEMLGFEIRVEIERYLEASRLYGGGYDVEPLHSEQYLKHFISTALLRVSGGLCLQEVTLYGNKQHHHKVDFIATHNGYTYAIEFKQAWIGTRNKKASGAHPRNALDNAWNQVADINKSILKERSITHRLALSLGTPWFKIKTAKEGYNEKIEKLEENLEGVRKTLKETLGKNFIEVQLRPLKMQNTYFQIKWTDDKNKLMVESFPSFFLLWKSSRV